MGRPSQSIEVLRSPRTKLASAPDEPERDFRIRLQQAMREGRDAALARVREKHASRSSGPPRTSCGGHEAAVERETQQASESKMSAAVSFGASVLGALLGKKAVSATNVGRVATAAKSMGRVSRESADVAGPPPPWRRSSSSSPVPGGARGRPAAVQAEWDPADTALERAVVKPKRGGVSVQLVSLVWRAG